MIERPITPEWSGMWSENRCAEVFEGKALLAQFSKASKRCHQNVVPRLDFRAGGSLLVAAERAFWLRDLIDHSVLNRMLGDFLNQ